MKKKCIILLTTITLFFSLTTILLAENMELDKEYDLGGELIREDQYYIMESRLMEYALDGTRIGTDVFRLYLMCTPLKDENEFQYTCKKFIARFCDEEEVGVPVLTNWSYIFKENIDEEGQVFGIDHGKFENLTNSNGNLIPPDKSYHVYNTFIDFHSFCDVFAAPTPEGNGIQDLTNIGQKIVHAAANSEPPTNLGSNIAEGSYFRNGEITLEFKGLSTFNGKTCALIGYDSGESSFKMISQPAPNFDIVTTGSSHYMGDIYKDLESNWVQKVTLTEFVVSETTLPVAPNIINSINERDILIRSVSQEEFMKMN
ncbi:MAG: hypothetical protein JW794_07265 [Candidatus Cloacimonetes bacterium]|nr:hypothetical protein [Candidatus Cloacimonadota bacterium]